MTPFNHHPKVSLYRCRCKNCGWTSHEILQDRIWEKKTRRNKVTPAYRQRRRGGKMGKFLSAIRSSGSTPTYKQRRVSRERMLKILASFKIPRFAE